MLYTKKTKKKKENKKIKCFIYENIFFFTMNLRPRTNINKTKKKTINNTFRYT